MGISTDLQVKRETKPGRHKVDNGDGYKGLFLIVRSGGQKSWMYRYQLNKSRIDMGLGRYPEVSLKEARDKHIDASRQVQNKEHPGGPKAEDKPVVMTFSEAADKYIELNESGWKNAKHAQQWRNTLRDYVHPKIGDMTVDKIGPRHVADLLEPIWIPMQETSSRVRSRIELVLDYALPKAGFADRKNPAMLKGLRGMLPKRTKVNKHEVVHHPAMPHADLPTFMVDLAARSAISARALEFTILTAAGSGEVRHLEWSDIDGAVWTIPAEKYKTHKLHQVPLSAPALAILERQPKVGRYVFGDGTNPLSENAMLALIKRMDLKGSVTAHGMRSSFKEWGRGFAEIPAQGQRGGLGA